MDYKKCAITLARKAGKIIKNDFALGMRKEWKQDNTPLTATDVTINRLVIDTIKASFPTHSIIAEEGSHIIPNSEWVWVCDPLDGTIPFSHGIPTCAFSLALTHNGQSVLGIVYDPFLDRMFYAEKGKGAFLNNKKISVSPARDITHSIIGLYDYKGSPVNLSALTQALGEQGTIFINVMSGVYMGVLVACGEFAATIDVGSKAYDSAAIKIITEEAGGKFTGLFGDEQRYDQDVQGHLAANPVFHTELLKLIRSTVKPRGLSK